MKFLDSSRAMSSNGSRPRGTRCQHHHHQGRRYHHHVGSDIQCTNQQTYVDNIFLLRHCFRAVTITNVDGEPDVLGLGLSDSPHAVWNGQLISPLSLLVGLWQDIWRRDGVLPEMQRTIRPGRAIFKSLPSMTLGLMISCDSSSMFGASALSCVRSALLPELDVDVLSVLLRTGCSS
jgi:hypothetical protein